MESLFLKVTPTFLVPSIFYQSLQLLEGKKAKSWQYQRRNHARSTMIFSIHPHSTEKKRGTSSVRFVFARGHQCWRLEDLSLLLLLIQKVLVVCCCWIVHGLCHSVAASEVFRSVFVLLVELHTNLTLI